MNLFGRTLKLVSWILLGKDKSKAKLALKYGEALMKNLQVKATHDGVTVRFTKKF